MNPLNLEIERGSEYVATKKIGLHYIGSDSDASRCAVCVFEVGYSKP